ncbi:prefoldin subunit 3 [Scaptodrosophila lebanonensis]|uniref:Prefoldin subunit 3 n=1 Tax=Drosophila lebanonensis TaxID=7225 RepID=A0A6J2UII9_DROLE|nr:prefoldin subunit 3 [Scaptodrosophila lebanonensis]
MFAFMEQIEKPPLPAGSKTYTFIEPADFIEDIESYVAKAERKPFFEEPLCVLTEKYSNYGELALKLEPSYAEQQINIEMTKANLKLIKKFQEEKIEFMTRVQLFNKVYKDVFVPPVESVTIVIPGNVHMQFPLDEAEKYVIKQLGQMVQQLKIYEHDLNYLRDQMSTTNLNITRVYKYNIARSKSSQKPGNVSTTSGQN